MKILVTGGCGYKGSVLVPKLLERGHDVTVLDTCWFGVHIPNHPRMNIQQGDLRDRQALRAATRGQEAVIHLAGIANDPCGELDAKLTWEVNVLATMWLADACVEAGIKRFIYASSGSVYGIKGGRAVVETDDMEPVSDYNKTKMIAERVLKSYDFALQIVRPATICGVSPRMRTDVVVNMLTAQAYRTGKIIAHCGPHGADLMRPNCHIDDVTDLYCWLIDNPNVLGTYNAGFENLSVGATARLIAAEVPSATLAVTEVQDKRSYAVDSSKLIAAGFSPKKTVRDAIREMLDAHRGGGIPEGDETVNLRWMQRHGLVQS